MTIPQIIGIINLTPDSFSDGGLFTSKENALRHAKQLIEEGADILDIGGESTRPGAQPINPQDEQARILPLLKEIILLAKMHNVKISVDTRNPGTMHAAIEAGADIINDVSALTHDPQSLNVIASSNAQIVLMHMQGTPETMQTAPHYADVVKEVYAFLEARINACIAAGIEKNRIIIDPGLGFGKTVAHNAALLSNARVFQGLGVPVLMGASRKSFLAALSDRAEAEKRLPASLAAAIMATAQDVQILRVHDVWETRQALMVWQALGLIEKA